MLPLSCTERVTYKAEACTSLVLTRGRALRSSLALQQGVKQAGREICSRQEASWQLSVKMIANRLRQRTKQNTYTHNDQPGNAQHDDKEPAEILPTTGELSWLHLQDGV